MFYFVHLRRQDSGWEDKYIIVVQVGPDDVIFVPYKYLLIPIYSNMELCRSIIEHSKYDGWEEGWNWNIDTLKLEQCPKPSGSHHCWVHHTQS